MCPGSQPRRQIQEVWDTNRSASRLQTEGLERIRYRPYGFAEPQWLADTNGDGAVDMADLNRVMGSFGATMSSTGYAAEIDVDSNGVIDLPDQNAVFAKFGELAPTDGSLWDAAPGMVGFGAGLYDEVAGLYLFRHRYYDPYEGRWITRDPAGYVDGMSLYQYVQGNPLMYYDPFGLSAMAYDMPAGGSSSVSPWDQYLTQEQRDAARASRETRTPESPRTYVGVGGRTRVATPVARGEMASMSALADSAVEVAASAGRDKRNIFEMANDAVNSVNDAALALNDAALETSRDIQEGANALAGGYGLDVASEAWSAAAHAHKEASYGHLAAYTGGMFSSDPEHDFAVLDWIGVKDPLLDFADLEYGDDFAAGKQNGLESALVCAASAIRFMAQGRELMFGKNFRVAPGGNRTGHKYGRWPHYHRQIKNADGTTPPGGSIRRHRPWEGGGTDRYGERIRRF